MQAVLDAPAVEPEVAVDPVTALLKQGRGELLERGHCIDHYLDDDGHVCAVGAIGAAIEPNACERRRRFGRSGIGATARNDDVGKVALRRLDEAAKALYPSVPPDGYWRAAGLPGCYVEWVSERVGEAAALACYDRAIGDA